MTLPQACAEIQRLAEDYGEAVRDAQRHFDLQWKADAAWTAFTRALAALEARCAEMEKLIVEAQPYRKKMEAAIAALETENQRMRDAMRVVAEQAADKRLWFKPVYITEACLQHELRRLHMAVEGKSAEECAIGVIRGRSHD